MELIKAKRRAEGIIAQLKPYCEQIEIAGSIRRQRPQVRDIDLVVIPSNQGQFIYALMQLNGRIVLKGNKLIRCELPAVMLDIYIATPETWATILLIRTGSIRHNIKLALLAKEGGLHLHADGTGLTRNGNRIAGDTEESIFAALRLPYKPPEEREC